MIPFSCAFFGLSLLALSSAFPQAANLPKPDPELPAIMKEWAEAQTGRG
jgi:hypothetical protein